MTSTPRAIPARRLRSGLRLLVPLLLAGCAGPVTAPAPERPVFPGFDAQRYPGDEALRTWRAASPYRWVGYYLPAPCHRASTWAGNRAALERQGWGLAVLYVGQQSFEGAPDPEPNGPILCSRTLLTAEQGERDALDAIAQAEGEGFPGGTVIFLDVERVAQVSPALREYFQAWIRRLRADGRYRPGVYAHRANAAELYLLAQEALGPAGATEETPFWVAGGAGFTLESDPGASGLPFADVWQGALDVDRTWGGVTLRIDENTADRPAPSGG